MGCQVLPGEIWAEFALTRTWSAQWHACGEHRDKTLLHAWRGSYFAVLCHNFFDEEVPCPGWNVDPFCCDAGCPDGHLFLVWNRTSVALLDASQSTYAVDRATGTCYASVCGLSNGMAFASTCVGLDSTNPVHGCPGVGFDSVCLGADVRCAHAYPSND